MEMTFSDKIFCSLFSVSSFILLLWILGNFSMLLAIIAIGIAKLLVFITVLFLLVLLFAIITYCINHSP